MTQLIQKTEHCQRFVLASEIILSGAHEGTINGWPIRYRADNQTFTDLYTRRRMTERWDPGSIVLGPQIVFSIQHSQFKQELGDALTVTHLPDQGLQAVLNARSESLTNGPEIWRAVRAGELKGWSVEFDILPGHLRMDGKVRVIQQGIVTGVSLVDRPAYDYAQAEARAQAQDTHRCFWWRS